MGSKPKMPQQSPAPPPISSTGADAAQDDAEARKKEKRRFDWSKSIMRPGTSLSALPEGTKSTLG